MPGERPSVAWYAEAMLARTALVLVLAALIGCGGGATAEPDAGGSLDAASPTFVAFASSFAHARVSSDKSRGNARARLG